MASTASAVTTLPPTTSMSKLPLIVLTTSSTPWEWPWRGVDHQQVDADLDERLGPLDGVGPDADGGTDAEAAPIVLGASAGSRCCFLMSLTVMSPRRAPVVVDDRELLDAVLPEDVLGLLERGADRRREQGSGLHHPLDDLVVVVDEAQVAVGEDPHQLPVAVDDGDTRRSCSGP